MVKVPNTDAGRKAASAPLAANVNSCPAAAAGRRVPLAVQANQQGAIARLQCAHQCTADNEVAAFRISRGGIRKRTWTIRLTVARAPWRVGDGGVRRLLAVRRGRRQRAQRDRGRPAGVRKRGPRLCRAGLPEDSAHRANRPLSPVSPCPVRDRSQKRESHNQVQVAAPRRRSNAEVLCYCGPKDSPHPPCVKDCATDTPHLVSQTVEGGAPENPCIPRWVVHAHTGRPNFPIEAPTAATTKRRTVESARLETDP